jgi:hypothetical protein
VEGHQGLTQSDPCPIAPACAHRNRR